MNPLMGGGARDALTRGGAALITRLAILALALLVKTETAVRGGLLTNNWRPNEPHTSED